MTPGLFTSDLSYFQNLATEGMDLPAISLPSAGAPAITPKSSMAQAASTSIPTNIASLFNLSRFVAIALGLIAIAGAIFLFKSPEVLQGAVKAAKAGAVA